MNGLVQALMAACGMFLSAACVVRWLCESVCLLLWHVSFCFFVFLFIVEGSSFGRQSNFALL